MDFFLGLFVGMVAGIVAGIALAWEQREADLGDSASAMAAPDFAAGTPETRARSGQ